MEVKRKAIIYSHYKSTGVGGVENLIRELQLIFDKHSINNIEIYHNEPKFESQDEYKFVNYNKVNINNYFLPSFLIKRIRTYFIFKKECDSKDNIIVLFHPESLLDIPNNVLKKSYVILVQTNKLDKLIERFGYLALKTRCKYINDIVLYTEYDLAEALDKISFYKNKYNIIPRGCKIPLNENCKIILSKKIVTIARIQESQKNFNGMIDIMNLLGNEYHLDIYGDGSDEEILTLKSKIKNISNMSFCGRADDIANILNNYSLFIMTSHYEGFGQTLIEARSQGLPIIAYNTFDALHWIIDDKQNGYIIDVGDVIDFKDKVELLLSNKSIFDDFKNKALIKARETQLSSINKKWESLILNIKGIF